MFEETDWKSTRQNRNKLNLLADKKTGIVRRDFTYVDVMKTNRNFNIPPGKEYDEKFVGKSYCEYCKRYERFSLSDGNEHVVLIPINPGDQEDVEEEKISYTWKKAEWRRCAVRTSGDLPIV